MLGKAEVIQKECLEKQKRILGPEHPSTLGTLFNLASNYFDQQDYAKAEDIVKQCLEKYKKVLGTHPETLRTMSKLVYIYKATGKHDHAAEIYCQYLNMKSSFSIF